MRFRISTLSATIALALTLTLGLAGTGATALADETASAAVSTDTKDILVLRSGTVVEGQILEEDGNRIKIMISVAGIQAPTTYRMSEILEVQRDIPVVTNLPGANEPDKADDNDAWGSRDDDKPVNSADKPKVYRFLLEGLIVGESNRTLGFLQNTNRRDIISFTPVEKTMRDALSYDPDLIIVEMDADAPSNLGWDGGGVATPLIPIFQEVIDDPDVRLVFWVKNANFGAAFLPFICPEIYFESEGTMGGIGTLDDYDIGDELVNEKQISLRIGAAEGVAIKNGYDPAIIRGMARQQNWLCYRFRAGKVEFLEHEPRDIDGDGWVILTDNGKGEFEDEMETRGNDVLNLDADTAREIELSKGTFDDIDDLIFNLGIRGEYDLIEGRAERNYDEWRDRVEAGLDRFQDLIRDFSEAGNGRDEVSKVLGLQRRLLRERRGVLTTYEEVFDPSGQRRAQIDIQLEQIREAILQAAKEDRERLRRATSRNRGR